MLFIHEDNIKAKLKSKKISKTSKKKISYFYETSYKPLRNYLININFTKCKDETFKKVAKKIEDYYQKAKKFEIEKIVTSQSKFVSTILEELNYYLFKDLPEIKSNKFEIFNKKVYAGLKIGKTGKIEIITKDVDFCIAKKSMVSIDSEQPINLIVPIVSIEAKTYLDATMFGEIKSSSRSLRSASPNSKTYVLMGYKSIKDVHIISARVDSCINEMFCLKKDEKSPIDWKVLKAYYFEISNAVSNPLNESFIKTPGKLLFP